MTKICKVCGKLFEAQQSTYTMCSAECRRKDILKRSKIYYDANKHEISKKNKKKRKQTTTGFSCKFCGEEVKPFFDNRMHRYHWHEECLIDKCIEAIKNGEPFGDKSKILKFASNKGYTKADVIEIMKERGETV